MLIFFFGYCYGSRKQHCWGIGFEGSHLDFGMLTYIYGGHWGDPRTEAVQANFGLFFLKYEYRFKKAPLTFFILGGFHSAVNPPFDWGLYNTPILRLGFSFPLNFSKKKTDSADTK